MQAPGAGGSWGRWVRVVDLLNGLSQLQGLLVTQPGEFRLLLVKVGKALPGRAVEDEGIASVTVLVRQHRHRSRRRGGLRQSRRRQLLGNSGLLSGLNCG